MSERIGENCGIDCGIYNNIRGFAMKMEFEFKLLQEVSIIELDRPGIILEILVDSAATWYKVRYFDVGEAKYIYFLEKELFGMKEKS